ncbi:DUF1963 domain-containing protein [Streptomyces sp. NPDC048606]|uniref:DUF1963 domain-containing protein n=1 Tax=Streptomyces sp. NPDC048606 TaxID=3154726 RepID=UPI003446F74F
MDETERFDADADTGADGDADGAGARALRDIAYRHLDEAAARRWGALVRPSVWLASEEESWGARGEPTVARLGGRPPLSADVPWPADRDGAPMAFVAAVDCGAVVRAGGLDLPLPSQGVLAFFASTPFAEDGAEGSRAGRCPGRVLHLPAGTLDTEHPAPPAVPVFPRVPLTACREPSAPFPDHPRVRAAFGLHTAEEFHDHPLNDQSFVDELAEYGHRFENRIGGYPAASATAAYEAGAGPAAHPAGGHPRQPGVEETDGAARWVALAQFQRDPAGGMLVAPQPGGTRTARRGVLLWLIRPEDLARRAFEEAVLFRAP